MRVFCPSDVILIDALPNTQGGRGTLTLKRSAMSTIQRTGWSCSIERKHREYTHKPGKKSQRTIPAKSLWPATPIRCGARGDNGARCVLF